VQEHHGGAAGHAGVAVGGAGGHALEQREHAAHLGDLVERADEVHLGGAGVGEADGDPRVDEGLDERACTVHRADSPADITSWLPLRYFFGFGPVNKLLATMQCTPLRTSTTWLTRQSPATAASE